MRIALILWATFACFAPDVRSETFELRGPAQGTTYRIKIASPPATIVLEQLKADIEQTLAEVDRQMSTYRKDSEISRFNRAPAEKWFEVSKATLEVVAASREISERTDGAQDVTVGPLVRLWHFGPSDGTGKAKQTDFKPPTDAEIQAARARVGYTKLEVRMDPPAIRKQVEGLEVDLSSIAPGYSVDRLAGIIRDRRIENFIVELGGEILAAGRRSDGTAWRIAIERPAIDKREMAAAVPLVDAAVATAGGSRHFFEFKGRRYSHLIDPTTGRPTEHVLSSVTVAADTCMEADGWDTPLMVLGLDRGIHCAEKQGIAAMFISQSEQGDVVRTTAAWRKRFGVK